MINPLATQPYTYVIHSLQDLEHAENTLEDLMYCPTSSTLGWNANHPQYVYIHVSNVDLLSPVRSMARFRKWLNLESVIGHKPAHNVMEVLGYLAYDTVREVSSLYSVCV